MAVGDDAKAAGFSLVPNNGEEGKIRWGAREINRTRDYIAQVKKLVPIGAGGHRTAAGISWGSATPTSSYGANGDIYFKIV